MDFQQLLACRGRRNTPIEALWTIVLQAEQSRCHECGETLTMQHKYRCEAMVAASDLVCMDYGCLVIGRRRGAIKPCKRTGG